MKVWIYFLSNNSTFIRRAVSKDAKQCLDIYKKYADQTAYSFEQCAPSISQMAERIESITLTYPWLVFECDQLIRGYAYASQFRPRAAYQWTAEVTVYLNDQSQGSGLATELYQQLFKVLVKQGFFNAIAVITEPNPQSERFHQKMGFEKIGVYKSIGYKLDQWHDIGWWQKSLQPIHLNPGSPILFADIDDNLF